MLKSEQKGVRNSDSLLFRCLGFWNYSRCPKTGRPDFGVFEKCPVVKSSRFQTLSEIGTILSGFRTFGWLTLKASGYQMFDSTDVYVGSSDILDQNGFQTGVEMVLV